MTCDVCKRAIGGKEWPWLPYIVNLNVGWIDGEGSGYWHHSAHVCGFDCLERWIEQTKKELGDDE